MAFKINVITEAIQDFDDAIAWYQLKSKNLGLLFMQSIGESTQRILLNPKSLQKISGSFRKINLAIFPYNIIYKVQGDQITIVAYWHQKRNPQTWKTRKTN